MLFISICKGRGHRNLRDKLYQATLRKLNLFEMFEMLKLPKFLLIKNVTRRPLFGCRDKYCLSLPDQSEQVNMLCDSHLLSCACHTRLPVPVPLSDLPATVMLLACNCHATAMRVSRAYHATAMLDCQCQFLTCLRPSCYSSACMNKPAGRVFC